MAWPHLTACFCAGAVLANAVPHVVAGMMGRPFQTPFARPRGEGFSSSTVNVAWGFVNLVVGYLLAVPVAGVDLSNGADAALLGAGALVLALALARWFGRFHGGDLQDRP